MDLALGLSQVPPHNFPAMGTALDQGAGDPASSIRQGHWGSAVYGEPSLLAQNSSAASKWPQRKPSRTVRIAPAAVAGPGARGRAACSPQHGLCLRLPRALAPHGAFLLDASREMGGG